MGNSTYKRVTDNPKAAWSEERKAAASAKQKQMIADGTWFKISKKQRSKNISKGLRDAAKRRNRSNGQLKRHANNEQKAIMNHAPTTLSENLLDKAVLPEVLNGVIEVAADIERGENPFPEPFETWDKKQMGEFVHLLSSVTEILDQAEKAFGMRPSLHWLLMTAIDEKMKNIYSLLGFDKEGNE